MIDKTPWKPQWQSDDFEIKSSEVAFDGHFKLMTYQLRFKKFSGEWSDWIVREQVQIYNSVAVLLYDPKEDLLVMVEQFRVGALSQVEHSPWLLEIVAGYADVAHETFEQAVIREAKEEANLDIKSVIPIYQYYPSPGGMSEKITIFCGIVEAKDVEGVYGNPHEHEDIKVHTLKYIELEKLFSDGMLTSSSTLIAFQWLQLNRAHLQSLDYV